ncbi:MAG: TIGR03960 family B12-binding radical SAM protein [Desulfosoma sp.]|uniref:TIGR03960 family B12-binding radical SAM protein n=1 Tax=Desulfosoma sp. TaxID=2603217 RepID=UPI00404AEE7B
MVSNSLLDQLLTDIERPGRYLGGEIHARGKSFEEADVRFALAFPDVYEVGMSHLGIQLLYHGLNDMEGVLADRVYTPWPDFEQRLRETRTSLFAIESRRPLKDFDFLGFSLQYELSYTNVLTMLDLAGIPLHSRDRDASSPFVIAGGPCAYNPEPVAAFFDLIILGEGEQVLAELTQKYRDWKASRGTRREFLQGVRHIKGVYVPSFFSPHYDASGRLEGVDPLYGDYTHVKKRVLSDLDAQSPLPERPLVPLVEIVHDRLGLEIARGCTRGCRFCQAGFVYRPVRERRPDVLVQKARRAVMETGFEEVSLLSLSTGDYCQLGWLLHTVMRDMERRRVALSFPSMRVGTLSQELMECIRRVRKTGFTVAPEAGSGRLRSVINKNIEEEDLYQTVRDAYSLGWKGIKLYFMMGLPTETLEDLEEIVRLSLRVWQLGKPYRAAVHVAVSTFVPKPMTPFQWTGQIGREEVDRRLEFLKERLKRPGIRMRWHSPDLSVMEAALARGDRRLAKVVESAWRKGARFDAWDEHFQRRAWDEAFAECGLSADVEAQRHYGASDPLPWDHLSAGVLKSYLWAEWQKALNGTRTGDCRWESCSGCGACDGIHVAPRLHDAPPPSVDSMAPPPRGAGEGLFTYTLHYAKKGRARFFGQLETNRIMERAVRRSGLPVAFTQGYHPHAKISFREALPVGMESEAEEADIQLEEAVAEPEIAKRLNKVLPEGFHVLGVRRAQDGARKPSAIRVTYRLSGLTEELVEAMITRSAACGDRMVRKKTKRGCLEARCSDVLLALRRLEATSVAMELAEGPTARFRPQNVLEALVPERVLACKACRLCKVSVAPLEE